MASPTAAIPGPAASGLPTSLNAVHFVPKTSRPEHVSDPSQDDGDEDCMCVLSLGDPFEYVIPSFQFLSVELRQIRVKGYTTDNEEKTYDMFIRNDPSLCRVYPTWLVAKDVTVIQVHICNWLANCS